MRKLLLSVGIMERMRVMRTMRTITLPQMLPRVTMFFADFGTNGDCKVTNIFRKTWHILFFPLFVFQRFLLFACQTTLHLFHILGWR